MPSQSHVVLFAGTLLRSSIDKPRQLKDRVLSRATTCLQFVLELVDVTESNLYAVDLPDLLDGGLKDELLTKFSIDLLKDLFSLLDKDTKAAKPKHPRGS